MDGKFDIDFEEGYHDESGKDDKQDGRVIKSRHKRDRSFLKTPESELAKITSVNQDIGEKMMELFHWFEAPRMYYANMPVQLEEKYKATKDDQPFIVDCKLYFWDETKRDCSDVIYKIWNPDYFNCFSIKTKSKVLRKKIRSIRMIVYINNFPEHQASKFPLSEDDTKATGIQLAVHTPGTKPQMATGFSLSPGTETNVVIEQTKRTRLGKPYRDTDCVKEKYMPGSDSELYTYDLCIDSCFQDSAIEKCKCLVEDLDFTQEQLLRANGRFCGNQSLNEIISEIEEIEKSTELRNMSHVLEFINKIRQLLVDERANRSANEVVCAYTSNFNVRACESKCNLPCKEHIYFKTVSSASWPHLYYHKAFYEQFIQNHSGFNEEFDVYGKLLNNHSSDGVAAEEYYKLEKELTKKMGELDLIEKNFLQVTIRFGSRKPFVLVDSEKYTWDSILGLFGGTLGLWSGLSLLSLLELVDLICCLVSYGFTKRMRSSNNGNADSSSVHR